MAAFKVKTKNKVDIDKKPRVYFTCHPDDFETHFQRICDDIFKTHDCAVYYTEDMSAQIGAEEREVDLGRINLFVVPVTSALLTTPNRAMDEDIPNALEKHIPVLPIMMETGIDTLYSKPDKFGQLQYLNPCSQDFTEIFYEEKLKKYLESVLISDALAKRVRAAFDAYIFLSYRKKDRRYANELMRLIHSIPQCRDIAIWFDEFLTPGESFKESIDKILHDSKLFALLVTPNLLEETGGKPNFVMAEEYPAARKSGKPIFPAEMEETDRQALLEKYEGIPDCVRAGDEEFHTLFLEAVSGIAVESNNTPEHNFLIGLAYLDGIDVEVNREFAIALITHAAEAELPEAMHKLICIYSDGIGVSADPAASQKWSERLAGYYFDRSFSKDGNIKSEKDITALFENYKDKYWEETIRCFLLLADGVLPPDSVKVLYSLILSCGICEYTLLFDTCGRMTRYPEQTRILLLADILKKSVEQTYPPYGPLFWYVPEYGLYETLLLALEGLRQDASFCKMLALTRDVCWILGHKNTCREVTKRVSGDALYGAAKPGLSGVRDGLCQLFYTGRTDHTSGADIYPRCFNVAEAVGFMENGCGVIGRMTTEFADELGLFSHTAYNELDREYIGVVACPYETALIEDLLTQKGCHKLTGLILSPAQNTKMEYMAINRRNLAVMYIPENISAFDRYEMLLGQGDPVIMGWDQDMSLWLNVTLFGDGLLYFTDAISLPDSIKKIPDRAFFENTKLKSVRIPDSVTVIGERAFMGCGGLTAVHLPEGITQIHSQAFSGCERLAQISLPEGITQLGAGAFSSCRSLTDIHIPAGVTQIGSGLFSGCYGLTAVELPPQLKRIPNSIFSACRSLTAVQLPHGVTEIGGSAFDGCRALTQLQIPSGVTKIGDKAFYGCEGLTAIHLPDHLTQIGWSAFYGCTGLTAIRIPDSVEKISMGAFSGCKSLSSVQISSRFQDELYQILPRTNQIKISFLHEQAPRAEKPMAIPSGATQIPDGMFENNRALRKIKIPKTVTKIGEKAFSQCCALESVKLPHSVREIGHSAFSNCHGLRKVRLSRSLAAIGGFAFYGCSRLRSVRIPMGVTEIGYGTFDACSSLKSVHIPQSVTKIDSQAFSGCVSLKKIKIPDSCKDIGPINTFSHCTSLRQVSLPDGIGRIGLGWFEGCSALTKVEIPHSVTEIGPRAFSGCNRLTAVQLPQGVVKLGVGAFSGCNRLTAVHIPSAVTELESEVFKDCASMTTLSVPKQITKIGSGALQGCGALSAFEIPRSVTEIGFNAFSGCTALKQLVLPEGLTLIDSTVFSNCSALTSVYIPSSVTQIRFGAFRNCGALTAVEIPENVSAIWEKAFSGCAALTKVEIPTEVRIIGDGAFSGCTGLTEVRISHRFEDDIARIFGDIDRRIISFVD